MKRNKVRRYTIKPEIANRLKLKINKHHRYRLSKEQEKKYFTLDIQPIKRLFFDIEKSLAEYWSFEGSGKKYIRYNHLKTPSKIICISYKWEDKNTVHTLYWDKNQDDKELLKRFIPILNSADESIAHNGDNYDIKELRTRCLMHNIPCFPKYKTLDTLKKTRYSFRFHDNKLDTIARTLKLGGKRKSSKYVGLDLWIAVQQGDKKAFKEMIYYCEKDVILLNDVYTRIENYIIPNTHIGVLNGGAKCDCPVCGSEDVEYRDSHTTQKGTIQRVMKCNICSYTYSISNASYMNFLKFKSRVML